MLVLIRNTYFCIWAMSSLFAFKLLHTHTTHTSTHPHTRTRTHKPAAYGRELAAAPEIAQLRVWEASGENG